MTPRGSWGWNAYKPSAAGQLMILDRAATFKLKSI